MQEADAIFYDGLTNRKRIVRVRVADGLTIFENGRQIALWPREAIRLVDRKPGRMRLRALGAQELARLVIADEVLMAALTHAAPNLFIEDHTRKASTARIVGWSVAAAASLLGVIFVGLPLAADRITPLLPTSFERRIGDMVDGQVKVFFGDKLCKTPDGQAAFLKLVRALEQSAGLALTADANVLGSGIPNAVALPGGRVYLFRGLLEAAESPDEVAGVLAHELGHVAHRDGMRMLIESGGASFLFGLLFGDVTGSGAAMLAAQMMLNASYTRDAEGKADDFAIATMHGLGRPSQPMGELLLRLTGAQRKPGSGVLASHPFSEDRLAKMKAADRDLTGAPILTEAEWQALKTVCRDAG